MEKDLSKEFSEAIVNHQEDVLAKIRFRLKDPDDQCTLDINEIPHIIYDLICKKHYEEARCCGIRTSFHPYEYVKDHYQQVYGNVIKSMKIDGVTNNLNGTTQ